MMAFIVMAAIVATVSAALSAVTTRTMGKGRSKMRRVKEERPPGPVKDQ